MTKYMITKSEKTIDGTSKAVVYGMECLKDEKVFASISDISANFCEVNELVEKCNTHELSCVHFYDVVADFLVSRS